MTSTLIWDLWEILLISADTNPEGMALPREGRLGMLGLMRRKVGVLHQTRTSNLCDLLERILSKGMVISGGKYLVHRGMPARPARTPLVEDSTRRAGRLMSG